MTGPTYRAGWRYERHPASYTDLDLGIPRVQIRRGQWKVTIPAHIYDDMTDDAFADFMARQYRETAFDQLQTDLAVLARQLLGQHDLGHGPFVVDGVPHEDLTGALYRYTTAARDTP